MIDKTFLIQALKNRNERTELSFYDLLVSLRQCEFKHMMSPSFLQDQRVDFIFPFTPDYNKIIKDTRRELNREIISNEEAVTYWTGYINCFVKIEPLVKREGYPYLSLDNDNRYGDVREVYSEDVIKKMLTDFYRRYRLE